MSPTPPTTSTPSTNGAITLDELGNLLNAMRDRKAELAKFEELFSEISGALADLVSHLEKGGSTPELAKALQSLSKIQVNVQPTPVQFNAPAPVVKVVQGDWKALTVKVSKPEPDGSRTYVITKTT